MIYGTTAENSTFVALDDLGSLGPLFDACRENSFFGLAGLYPLPATAISPGDPVGFKPPTPSAPAGVMLPAGTVLADTWLVEAPTPAHGDAAEAKLFARIFAALIIAVQPKQVKQFSSSYHPHHHPSHHHPSPTITITPHPSPSSMCAGETVLE